MRLFADRFIIADSGTTVDLATGDAALVVVSPSSAPAEQAQWAARCDRFFRLRHSAIARLLDYGIVGESSRFEAWLADGPWRKAPEVARTAFANAQAFLRAARLTGFQHQPRDMRWKASPIFVPDGECGLETDETNQDVVASLDVCGLSTIDRPELSLFDELFPRVRPAPQVFGLSGAHGSGLRTALHELARKARLAGLTPVRTSVLPGAPELLRDRSLFLILCETDLAQDEWLRWIVRSPKGHFGVVLSRTALRRIEGIALKPLSAVRLAGAITPGALDERLQQRVREASIQARGLPGRFAAILWGPSREDWTPQRRQSPVSRAAEGLATYGDVVPARPAGVPAANSWATPGELTALRLRSDRAIAQLASGRRAAAERAVRQTVAALARRRDWRHAAKGAGALAAALIQRGRARDAVDVLKLAEEYATRGNDPEALALVAELSGAAWMDIGKYDEAEAVLTALVHRPAETPSRGPGQLALARCLFWRGRYYEARSVLAGLESSAPANAVAVRATLLSLRVAVALNDAAGAVTRAAAGRAAADRLEDASLDADAAYGAAFAHLAVGDHSAVEEDVRRAVAAARLAHVPLVAVKARLVGAESARRLGRPHTSARIVSRLERVQRFPLPATVKARCELLRDLLSAPESADVSGIVARRVGASRLPALALYAPIAEERQGSVVHLVVDDSLDILRCCQTGDDQTILAELCIKLRDRLGAAAVAIFGADGSRLFAAAGRLENDIAHRVVAAGQTIAPHRHDHRIEGGAPVRYSGQTIGAVVARWTPGSLCDPSRAGMVLTMAATAVGPAVAGAVAQQQAGDAAGHELAGTSLSMETVRRTIARAASAPFPVLIQGESGSGKELAARALHRGSSRSARPFVSINCAALPDDLIEAELFGHSRGAFTGALADRPGVFEEAHTGTLFLDEIGELAPRGQAKLLRAIQDGEIRRVGENATRRIDVRFVAATNRDLLQEAAAGRFRLDLLYRLDVVSILLPPLRDRREDIPVLAAIFWREAADRVGSRATLSSSAVAALTRYDWPGNVRELQNVLAALAVRSPRRGVVPASALPMAFGETESPGTWRLDGARRTFEERFVRAALVRAGGQRTRAAVELGVTRQGLTKLMTRLGITETCSDS
jgi:DNA-binding NtrC family response regulator/tetratricopeptide (TPR) repeat protein